MAVEQIGDDRTAPDKAAMKWRAASRRFVSGRGGSPKGSGVRNLGIVVAGRRLRRSRSPIRHASSSPQMGCRKL
ncbi:hypothetical protein BV900_24015 [Agrobacterium tumefaciens]|nr:hypothetical protein BV900_24015 [Agrobacterium tumefaciens]